MTTKMLNGQNCVATGAPNQGNQNSIYDFYVVDEKVVVVPMKTLFCKRIIEAFNKSMKGVIMPNRCFANALIAADWFNERGFDVEVVEGTIEPNDYCFKWSEKTGRPVYSTKHPRLNEVTMFVIQMKNALRGLSAPAAWQTPEKFFIRKVIICEPPL